MSDHSISPDSRATRRAFLRGQRPSVPPLAPVAEAPPSSTLSASAADGVPPISHFEQFTHRAMACLFQVVCPRHHHPQSASAALQFFQEIDRYERLLSIFVPESDACRLNAQAAIRPCVVNPETFELLELSQALARSTGGAFDITASPLSRVWGFLDGAPRQPAADALAQALRRVAWRDITLFAERNAVQFQRADLEINFHGIGKGWAIERAAARLRDHGLTAFVVHGGQSSVLAVGRDEGWEIGLSHPLIPERRLASIVLRNEALSTSGTGRQGFFSGGRRFGHILDPRSGWPAEGVLSTTVIHPSAALCDALSTACFVMSESALDEWCAAHRDVAVIRVVRDVGGVCQVQTWNLGERVVRWVSA